MTLDVNHTQLVIGTGIFRGTPTETTRLARLVLTARQLWGGSIAHEWVQGNDVDQAQVRLDVQVCIQHRPSQRHCLVPIHEAWIHLIDDLAVQHRAQGGLLIRFLLSVRKILLGPDNQLGVIVQSHRRPLVLTCQTPWLHSPKRKRVIPALTYLLSEKGTEADYWLFWEIREFDPNNSYISTIRNNTNWNWEYDRAIDICKSHWTRFARRNLQGNYDGRIKRIGKNETSFKARCHLVGVIT